jgi:hypothetical protein
LGDGFQLRLLAGSPRRPSVAPLLPPVSSPPRPTPHRPIAGLKVLASPAHSPVSRSAREPRRRFAGKPVLAGPPFARRRFADQPESRGAGSLEGRSSPIRPSPNSLSAGPPISPGPRRSAIRPTPVKRRRRSARVWPTLTSRWLVDTSSASWDWGYFGPAGLRHGPREREPGAVAGTGEEGGLCEQAARHIPRSARSAVQASGRGRRGGRLGGFGEAGGAGEQEDGGEGAHGGDCTAGDGGGERERTGLRAP